ncbi:MAG TPA: DUF6602 domain-containing protein [Candidatus Baltobacteraceae bacterium]|jgi:hypothetical protein
MPNRFLLQRLAGIQAALVGAHQASSGMSSNTTGAERQEFIESFLRNVLPTIYRFGTGDATDLNGAISGQLDVVVESPFAPTLPNVGLGSTRLYLAESIAAVIEVKSDISKQWTQAIKTAAKLAPLRRTYTSSIRMTDSSIRLGAGPVTTTDAIPLFVAAFTGWTTMASLTSALSGAADISGILIIDAGLFASSSAFGGVTATGPSALWELICALDAAVNKIQMASIEPKAYLK